LWQRWCTRASNVLDGGSLSPATEVMLMLIDRSENIFFKIPWRVVSTWTWTWF
jgi:hypothetical protein